MSTKKPYGNVNYADPGFQSDKKKRYPLDTEKHVRAAASYFGMEKNRSKYSSSQQKAIASKIAAAEKKFGIGKKEMSEDITIDAFKAGKYPQGEFGEKELNEIVSTYDPTKHEAPILIGHVSDPSYQGKSTIPAFGWISEIKKVGNHLKFVASQFSEELKGFIQQGLYKKVSAAFYEPTDPTNPTPGKWHLHHLAFLGGTPPAVKGLEGIAFAEMSGNGVSFAEMDVEGIDWEEIEDKAIEDTLQEIQEEFDECMKCLKEELIQDPNEDEDDDPDELAEKRSNCFQHIFECYNETCTALTDHFELQDGINELEENDKSMLAEMAEKIKGLVVEFAAKGSKLFSKHKEDDVDKQKEQEYKDKIAGLELKVTEFTEKERLANESRVAADQAAAVAAQSAKDDALKATIKEFCDAKVKDGKMTPAMREKDEPKMFEIGKSSEELLKSFQEKYDVQLVNFNETVPTSEKEKAPDGRSELEKNAETYAKGKMESKAKEFADCHTLSDGTSRAMYLHSVGKAKF